MNSPHCSTARQTAAALATLATRMAPRALVALCAGAALPARAAGQAAAHAVEVPSLGAAGFMQAGFGLVLVLALVFGCAWLAKRFGLQRPLAGGPVKIIGGASVGHRERVVVVSVAGDWLVLGVAPGQVRTLHTIAADQVPPDMPMPAPSAAAASAMQFAQRLQQKLRKDR